MGSRPCCLSSASLMPEDATHQWEAMGKQMLLASDKAREFNKTQLPSEMNKEFKNGRMEEGRI